MLISEDYRKQQELAHEDDNYGIASKHFAPLVSQLINSLEVKELLDYGAGKGRLMQNLEVLHKIKIQCYDPGVPKWSESPQPSEMVCCIDVLEHIEPHLLHNVLTDLKRVTQKWLFVSVDCGPANRILADGRNAHLIQKPPSWWLPRLMAQFDLYTYQAEERGFWALLHGN